MTTLVDQPLMETINKLPGLIREELAADQPKSFISMGRNLSYFSDPTANPASDKADAVFECLIMIRNDQDTVNNTENTEGTEVVLKELMEVASEVLWLWFRCAVDFYEGNPPPEQDNEEVQMTYAIRSRSSAQSVTVFGGIQDKEGRYFNLTVTDQSDIWSIHNMMQGATRLWDWTTESLSSGLDHNVGGKKDRTTKVGKDVKSKKRPTTTSKKKTTSNDKNVDVDKETATYCNLFSELLGLKIPEDENHVEFRLNLASMTVKPKGDSRILYFGGFTEDAQAKLVEAFGRNLSGYYFENDMNDNPRPEFQELVNIIEEKGENDSVKFESGIASLYGNKRISVNGNAYYTHLEFEYNTPIEA